MGEKSLCVIAFLPHILDCQSKCRNNYIKMLKNLGDKFKKQGWGWLWTEGAAQLKLEDALNVGGFGYPALSVVSAKKMKYSILTGTYIKIFSHFFRTLFKHTSQIEPTVFLKVYNLKSKISENL